MYQRLHVDTVESVSGQFFPKGVHPNVNPERRMPNSRQENHNLLGIWLNLPKSGSTISPRLERLGAGDDPESRLRSKV